MLRWDMKRAHGTDSFLLEATLVAAGAAAGCEMPPASGLLPEPQMQVLEAWHPRASRLRISGGGRTLYLMVDRAGGSRGHQARSTSHLSEAAMSLAAILVWYVGIGVLAATGTVTISRAWFSPRVEHSVFALLLIPIAAMYLVFVAYFGDGSTPRPEAYAVAVFVVLALLGLRFPALLVLGYALHGGWDLAHEIRVHLGAGGARRFTDIPLAYGAFCAAYDWCLAGYFLTRQGAWRQ
jgi:hypothetical protein